MYFSAICAFLNTKEVDYEVTKVSTKYTLIQSLEGVAVLYTKEFPDTAVNESIFIKRETSCYGNFTMFKFTYEAKHIQTASITTEAVVDALDSCEPKCW